MFKKKLKLSPAIIFILLTIFVILLSGFLNVLNIQGEYISVNKVTGEFVNNVVEVKNIFSLSGMKYILTNAINGFVNFKPLGALIIVLIGIGVLEKTGFTKSFFTLLTRNTKKNTITFILVFLCLIFSIVGEIGFVIMMPIGALLFKYGRRNPLGGIICSFAALSFGTGINIFLSANDSSLLTLTLDVARVIDTKYEIGIFFSIFIMIIVLFITSFVFTSITEKKIMAKLSRVESEDEEYIVSNKELRGIIIGIGVGIIYVLFVIYMIIPNLPLSGLLLDQSASRYIDMLFGINSLFNKGFIFIVTLFFVIIGIFYGLITKTIKNNNDISESLSYSLDKIGNILVLIFFASLFISVYDASNIGQVLTSFTSSIISGLKFTGSGLIIVTFILIIIVNIFLPSSLMKWKILNSSVICTFMNASISPEFAQILYVAAESVTNGITPLFAYYVIYIALLEKFNKGSDSITLFGSARYMIPYSVYIMIIWIVVLLVWYLIGIPLGIGSFPGVMYGS